MFEGLHYQNDYICDDIELAIAMFRDRAELGGIRIFDTDQVIATPNRPKRIASRLAFVWIEALQFEPIQVVADEIGLYAHCQDNGGPLRFHHICMRVSCDWTAFRARIAAQDFSVVMERANDGDELKFLFLDARGFCGHYIEYCWMTDARWSQLRAM